MNTLTAGFARPSGRRCGSTASWRDPFLTDVTKAWDMDAFNQGAQRFALQRGGQPDEVVGAALYFASDASSFTTGQVLRVDGGIP